MRNFSFRPQLPGLGFVIALTLVATLPARADEPPSAGGAEPSPSVEPAAPPPPEALPPGTAPVPPAPVGAPSAPVAAVPAAPPPVTPPEARFGDARVLSVNGAITGTIHHSDVGSSSMYDVTLAPGFDYFASENLSLGASALVGYDHTTASMVYLGQTIWRWGATGQVGLNLWLAERLSFWPKAFLEFEQFRTTLMPPVGSTVVTVGPTQVGNVVSVGIYAPFLLHLATHFFVGLGPSVTVDLHNSNGVGGASNRATAFGVSSVVGGWL
ncbi:MAG TPA: hypothetical protein VKZ18_16080 [Polyangia bacterium]|nr:hypothetical protein [Polyangia bacterium]